MNSKSVGQVLHREIQSETHEGYEELLKFTD